MMSIRSRQRERSTGPTRRIRLAGGLAVVAVACLAAGAGAEPGDWREEHFEIGGLGERVGWVDGAVEAGAWKPVAQPRLADALAEAPKLELEDVAPAPQRCWVGHRPYLVPNRDGKSWDMVYPYFKAYRQEQEVVIHDFGTGRTRKQRLSTREGDSVLTREGIGFHMQPSFYADGKLIFENWGAVIFSVYDPGEDRFVHGAKPFGDAVINGRCVLADDGMIYGMGWPKDKSAFVAYRFDPKTYKAKLYEPFGPANEHRRELYRRVVISGDWLYAGVGNRPWHLVAFNVRTGEGRLLAESKPIRGDHNTVEMNVLAGGGVAGSIAEPAKVPGLGDVGGDRLDFWLRDGRLIRRKGKVPPWSDKPCKRDRRGQFHWDRQAQHWPADFEPPSPPPIIPADAGDPDPRGRVSLPYRIGKDGPEKTLEYTVRMYPGVVKLLREIADGVLFATDEGYGQHVFYDLAGKRLMRVGGTLSPYSAGLCGGRLYVSGYPGSQVVAYDFSRTLGLQQDEPNPWRVGYLGKGSDSHCPLAGTVAGADGRVYNAGTTYGRRRVGGGFGWYDPNSGEIGGMPFDGHRIFWMTAAADGRYILMSSKHGDAGELICWDTRTRKLIYRKAVLDAGRPGPVVEALPGGLVMGHHDSGVLYGLNAATGEVLWRKAVPARPVTGFGDVRRHAYSFRRGPDGWVWSFFDKTLVRIDPRTAKVVPIGRIDRARQIAFASGGVYMAGGSLLRRIKGLRAARPGEPR